MPSVTYKSAVVNKVMDSYDDPLAGIVASVSTLNKDMPETLLDYFQNGWFSRVESYYRYGASQFARGLPTDAIIRNEVNTDEIKRIIEALVGNKILFSYVYLSEDSYNHYVRQYLQDTRHMDSITQLVPLAYIPPDIGAPVDGPMQFIDWMFDETNSFFLLKYSYFSLGESRLHTESVPIEFTNELIYQVEYRLLNADLSTQPATQYWLYELGLGTYPILDKTEIVEAVPTVSNYYPVVPFYEDKEKIGDIENKGTPLYDTSKKLVSKLGFDYEDLVEKLSEGDDETIGNNKGMWLYLYLGIEATAGIPSNYFTASGEEIAEARKEAQVSIQYLIEFFIANQKNNVATKSTYDAWVTTANPTTLEYNVINIVNESFDTQIKYLYADISVKSGAIADIGLCTSDITLDTVLLSSSSESIQHYLDANTIIYRRQETVDTYTEVTVKGFVQHFKVQNGYVAIAAAAAFDEDSPLLTAIPLDRSVVKSKIKSFDRNRLVHAALRFVICTYIKQDLSWYQTFAGRFIIYAVALYLSVPTGGNSLSFAKLFTIAGLKAAAIALIKMYLKYIIFKQIVQWVAKQFGEGAALVLSLVFIAYGKGAKVGSFPKLPWAIDLVSIGSTMWSASNQMIQEKTKEIEKDYSRLQGKMELAQKELNKANELLNTSADLDPWLFVNPLPDLMFGQDADTFINVRVHNSNPGIASLSAPSNYVDLMLTLPTIDDTLTK